MCSEKLGTTLIIHGGPLLVNINNNYDMLKAYESTLYSERTDSINLFSLYTFQINNAHKAETCQVFKDRGYLSTNAQPPLSFQSLE
jgi:hypothetical protein